MSNIYIQKILVHTRSGQGFIFSFIHFLSTLVVQNFVQNRSKLRNDRRIYENDYQVNPFLHVLIQFIVSNCQ